MIPLILCALATAWFVYSMLCLRANVRRARAMNIPLILVPVSPMNALWIVSESIVYFLLDRLPVQPRWAKYARRGWHFNDKAATHQELGEAFAVVTPRETFLHICEPGAIADIFARRQDFVRPVQLYRMMNIFGDNVATVQAKEWQRHRKVVAAPFNESTNSLVWSESLSQARDMLSVWVRNGRAGTMGTAKDTRTLSLDVLAATGFKKSYRFRASTEPGPDEARNYRGALKVTLDNALFMMLVPAKILNLPFAPKSWATVGRATMDLRQYMMNMLNEEVCLLDAGKPGTGNLMSSLVRASEDDQKKKGRDTADGPKGLSMSEILGNMLVINFAGHDTTANTLAYAVLLLAAYPEVQEWVGEELDTLLPSSGNSESRSYDELFPRLKRCLAVMYETLRLFPPIMALPKYTNQRPQTLQVGTHSLAIDGGYQGLMITPSLLAVQTHPQYWGANSLEWRPRRWISSDATSEKPATPASLDQEEFFTPAKGTYLPWSEGLQNCPGKKFAQVEFVAVMACLFQRHRVALLREGDEDAEGARRRILAACEDSEHGLLLRMRDGDSICLTWAPKSSR